MAFNMKLSASLLLLLFIAYHPIAGDSSSNSEEEDQHSADPIITVVQENPSKGDQIPPSMVTAAAKYNLFHLISSGRPTAPEADEEEESVTTAVPFIMPKIMTTSAPAEQEDENEEGQGEQSTQIPFPEIQVPLEPIQLPIPRIPLPPAPMPQRPLVPTPQGIITISSPPVQVGNPAFQGPIASLYPVAPIVPKIPLPNLATTDDSDIYCIMSTGDCVPSNTICNGVVLNSFCSGPSRSCCVPLNSKRAFGL